MYTHISANQSINRFCSPYIKNLILLPLLWKFIANYRLLRPRERCTVCLFVCLSVCPFAWLEKKHTADLRQIFCACSHGCSLDWLIIWQLRLFRYSTRVWRRSVISSYTPRSYSISYSFRHSCSVLSRTLGNQSESPSFVMVSAATDFASFFASFHSSSITFRSSLMIHSVLSWLQK